MILGTLEVQEDPRLLGDYSRQSWILDPARMKPNEIHWGGIQDPKLLTGPLEQFWIHDPTRMKPNERRVLDPILLGKTSQQSWILDLGSHPNEFHSVSFGWGPRSVSAILDLGSRLNELHSVSYGGGPGSKIAGKDFPAIFRLGSRPNKTE